MYNISAQPVISDFGNKSNTLFLNQKIALGGCYAGGPDQISITGSGFLAGTTVSVNGILAPSTIVNSGLLFAQVPYYNSTISGRNISGLIRVANGLGAAVSVSELEVIFCIDFQFGSTALAPGTIMRVDGGDLDKITSISIAGTNTAFAYNLIERKLFVNIPPTLPGGNFDVIFSQGIYTQIPSFPFSFTKANKPIITQVTSSTGVGGSLVIHGQHFAVPSWLNAVKIDGKSVAVLFNSGSTASFSILAPAYVSGGEIEVTNLVTGLSTTYSKGYVRSSIINSLPTLSGTSFALHTISGADEMQGLKTADVNTDGKLDLVFVEISSRKIVVLLNTTPASVRNPIFNRVELATLPTSLIAGLDLDIIDVNADGKVDISISDFNTEMYVLPNLSSITGTMSFGALLSYTLSGPNTSPVAPSWASWGDIDGDGKPDALTSLLDGSTRYITMLRNQSETPRITSQSLEINGIVRTLTGGELAQNLIADFDGDGKQEFILADNGLNASFSLYSFTGFPGTITASNIQSMYTYQAATSVSTRYFTGFQAFDVNTDGKLDFIVLDNVGSQMLVFQNTSTGIGHIGFAPPVGFSITSGGTPYLSVKSNLDGELSSAIPTVDITLMNIFGSGFEVVMFQNKNVPGANIDLSTFGSPFVYSVTGTLGSTFGIDAGDVNNDGLTDVIFVGPDQQVSFLINTACPAYNILWPDYGIVSYDQSVGGTIYIETSLSGLNLQYQWYLDQSGTITTLQNNTVFAGVTTTGLSITGVPLSLSGARLFLVASPFNGACLPFTSPGIVTLQVVPCFPVGIVSHPTSVLGCLSGLSTFSVVATGTGLSFQWQEFNGVSWTNAQNIGPFSGVNSSILGINNPPGLLSGRRYRVIIADICGNSTTSTGGVFIINQGISILAQPISPASVCVGIDSLLFSVSAIGFNLNYTWQYFNGSIWQNFIPSTDVIGANSSQLVLRNPQLTLDQALLRVVISDNCSNTVSSDESAQITLLQAPFVISQPNTPNGVCAGTGALIFSSLVSGSNNVYHWQILTTTGWVNLPLNAIFSNVNTENLIINNPPYSLNGRQVRLSISGACLNQELFTDSTAYIQVFNTTPDISLQPISDTICDGVGTSRFVVSALGNNLSYQWQRFVNNTWQLLPLNSFFESIDSDTLTVINPPLELNGQAFRVQVQGSCSVSPSVTNGNAVLTIYAKPQISFLQASVCQSDSNIIEIEPNVFYTRYQWTYSSAPIVNDTLLTHRLLADGEYGVYVNGQRQCASNNLNYALPVGERNPVLEWLGDTVLQAPAAKKYQWYVYDKALQGDTLPNLRVWYNGPYKVDLVYSNDCFTSSQSYNLSKPEWEDAARYLHYISDSKVVLQNQHLQLSPNPTSGKIILTGIIHKPTILIQDIHSKSKIELQVDKTSKKEHEIDLKKLGLSAGFYMLKIDNTWFKIVLQ